MDSTVQRLHTLWCDRFHDLIGSRECSAKYEFDGHHSVLRYGDATGVDDLVFITDEYLQP